MRDITVSTSQKNGANIQRGAWNVKKIGELFLKSA